MHLTACWFKTQPGLCTKRRQTWPIPSIHPMISLKCFSSSTRSAIVAWLKRLNQSHDSDCRNLEDLQPAFTLGLSRIMQRNSKPLEGHARSVRENLQSHLSAWRRSVQPSPATSRTARFKCLLGEQKHVNSWQQPSLAIRTCRTSHGKFFFAQSITNDLRYISIPVDYDDEVALKLYQNEQPQNSAFQIK